MIHIRDVIAILDIHSANSQTGDKGFIRQAELEGKVEKIATEDIKSYVITNHKIYASPISSITLKKRAEAPLGSKKI